TTFLKINHHMELLITKRTNLNSECTFFKLKHNEIQHFIAHSLNTSILILIVAKANVNIEPHLIKTEWMPKIKLGDDMYENKNQEEQEKNIIDKDLYENFSEEELLTYFEEARQQSEEKERNKKKKKSIFSRWIVWVIALAMLFQVIAILPETFSIPA